jgi:ornithine decarboxylase
MLFQLQKFPFTPIILNRVISAIMALLPASREAANTGKTIHIPAYRATSPGDLIDLAIESQIARIVKRSVVGGDDSFFVADLGQIIRQHRRWTNNMPGILPFYGM